ncbi:MAG: hypothetical protein LUG13_00325 [Oscillospiraceae bacterium]|nr:hypothetical protein [Oscillospiraceae bacterium]
MQFFDDYKKMVRSRHLKLILLLLLLLALFLCSQHEDVVLLRVLPVFCVGCILNVVMILYLPQKLKRDLATCSSAQLERLELEWPARKGYAHWGRRKNHLFLTDSFVIDFRHTAQLVSLESLRRIGEGIDHAHGAAGIYTVVLFDQRERRYIFQLRDRRQGFFLDLWARNPDVSILHEEDFKIAIRKNAKHS